MSERIENLLQGFSDDRLPARLQAMVAPFKVMADQMVTRWSNAGVPEPELKLALQKLHDAKEVVVEIAIRIKEREAQAAGGGE